MNTRNIFSLRGMTGTVLGALLLAGLTTACSTDDSDKGNYTGDPVRVKFQLNASAFGANETVTETRGSLASAPATTSLDLGGGYILEATLEEAQTTATRAVIDLPAGRKVGIIAYRKTDGAMMCGAIYTADGTGAMTAAGEEIMLPPGDYDVVAFSYAKHEGNTGAAPDIATLLAALKSNSSSEAFNDFDCDIIWTSQEVTIEASDKAVSLVLEHLLSKLRVEVACYDNAQMVTDVSATIKTKKATFDVKTGSISLAAAPNDLDHTIDFRTAAGNADDWLRTSYDMSLFYNNSTTTTINLTGLSIDNNPVTLPVGGLDVVFNKQLSSGHAYTLRITVSNVWNYLDFVNVAGDSDIKYIGSGTFASSGVKLDDFEINKYETIQALWTLVMTDWPGSAPNTTYGLGTTYPAYNISWNDIVGTVGTEAYFANGVSYKTDGFCAKLTALAHSKNKHMTYRFALPTEYQWEYAARGGKGNAPYNALQNNNPNYVFAGFCGSSYKAQTPYDDTQYTTYAVYLNAYAWQSSNSGASSKSVATKKPNYLGLFDMSGNVWEWCADYTNNSYPAGPINPVGDVNGTYRIYRGGSWSNDQASAFSVSERLLPLFPVNSAKEIGFRLVRVAIPPAVRVEEFDGTGSPINLGGYVAR